MSKPPKTSSGLTSTTHTGRTSTSRSSRPRSCCGRDGKADTHVAIIKLADGRGAGRLECCGVPPRQLATVLGSGLSHTAGPSSRRSGCSHHGWNGRRLRRSNPGRSLRLCTRSDAGCAWRAMPRGEDGFLSGARAAVPAAGIRRSTSIMILGRSRMRPRPCGGEVVTIGKVIDAYQSGIRHRRG